MKCTLWMITLGLTVGALFLPAGAAAQAVPGLSAWGTYQGGKVDSIDVSNRQLRFTLPMVNKRGVGLDFNVPLTYPSISWQIENNQFEPAGGWIGAAVVGGVWFNTLPEECTDDLGDSYYFNVYSNFGFSDPAGVNHTMVNSDTGQPVVTEDSFPWECDPSQDPGYPNYVDTIANDGSGWTGGSGSGFVTAPDGSYVISAQQVYDDRHGNHLREVVVNYEPTYVDTLGVTELAVSSSGTTQIYSFPNPQGGQSEYQVFYTAYTLQTNFGCSGVGEYSATRDLPTEVELPDGTAYTFHYEQTPGYGATYTTGRVTSMQLPTGATISYGYTGGNDDVDCATGNTASITRTTPDGGTSYAETAANQTTVTDPGSNRTVYNFNGTFLMSKTVYQGSSTMLSYDGYCYTGEVAYCTGDPATQGVSTVDHLSWLAGGIARHTETIMSTTAGAPSEVDESDWSTGADDTEPILRKTLTSYGDSAYPGLPTEVKVEDGAGTAVSDTQYSRNSQGDPTTITYAVSGSASLTRSLTYNTNGTVATDSNGGGTSYTYGDCNGGLPTQVTAGGLTRTMTWDCNGGVVTSATDENGNTIDWAYNGSSNQFWRPTEVTDAAAGRDTTITYGTAAGAWTIESAMTFNNGASTSDTLTTFDGLGRTVLVQKRQAPNSSSWDSVQTTYDAEGRPYQVSMPYTAGSGVFGGSAWSATVYDALGRPTSATDAGGGVTSYAYAYNDVAVTRGPTPTVTRQLQYDGMGGLSSVCEETAATGSGACGQSTSATGFLTTYTRNPAGAITGVAQNAQGTPQEARSFVYDELGRMTAETTPESGATAFSFDVATTDCPTGSAGDLVQRTDAAGNVTCYTYDAMHRLTSTTYPVVASGFATAPDRHFVYDAATVDGVPMANAKGRLAEAYTGSSRTTDLGFSYTVPGQMATAYQKSTNSGGWYVDAQTYFPNGAPETLGTGAAPLMTYGLDGEGRPTTVGAATGQDPVTAASYSALGLTAMTLGSGDSDSYIYDPNTGRMKQYSFSVNGVSDTGVLTWAANGSLTQLAINDAVGGTSDTGTCTYSQDDLGRLASASCPGVSQTFDYDAFGNMATTGSGGGKSFSASFNLKNEIASVGSITPTYDADGDLTSDPANVNQPASQYDAEGKPQTFDGATVVFDALGRAVEAGGQELVYAPSGAMIAVMTGQTADTAYVPLPGGGAAVYQAGSLAYYRHADWEGSGRLASTPSRTLEASAVYAPYGEAYAASGGDVSFTGQNQLYGSDQYNFLERDFSPVQGRWWTPDPAGMAAVDPSNPQSWNRYGYVGGAPLTATDPLGLMAECMTINGVLTCVTDANANKSNPDSEDEQYLQAELTCEATYGCGIPELGGNFAQTPAAGGGNKFAPADWSARVGSNLECAAGHAEAWSPAGVAEKLGLSGPLAAVADAVGGNAFSGATDLVASLGSGSAGGHSVFYHLGAESLAGPALGVLPPGVGGASALEEVQGAIGGALGDLWNAGAGLTTLAGTVSTAAASAAEIASGLGFAKYAYDAAMYFGAAALCEISVLH